MTRLPTFADYYSAFLDKFPVLRDLPPDSALTLRYTFYRGATTALTLVLPEPTDADARAKAISLKHEAWEFLIERVVGEAVVPSGAADSPSPATLAGSFAEFFSDDKIRTAFSHENNARETFYAGATAALLTVTDPDSGEVKNELVEALVPQLSSDHALHRQSRNSGG